MYERSEVEVPFTAPSGAGAVVLGASRGIGRSLALQLAQEGHTVAALGRDVESLREVQRASPPGSVSCWPCDASQSAGFVRVLESVAQSLPRASVVVHCAASVEPVGPVWELDTTSLITTLSLNVTSAYLTAGWALAQMLTHRSGRLVLISSGAARRPSRFRSAYAGSKASVDHLVRTAAEELRDLDVDVAITGVYPGVVDTGMQTRMREIAASSPDRRVRHEMEAAVRRAGAGTPPSDVARAVIQLLSRDAGEINGKIMALRHGAWEES